MRTAWLSLVIVSLLLTLAFAARAASVGSGNVVLVVVPSGDNVDYAPFENRLRSELIAAGHSTITATLPAPIEPADLPAQARQFGASICVSVSIVEGMVVGFVSVADPASERIVLRPIPGYPIGEPAASVFAVRATDVLHGVLLEMNFAPSAPPKPLSSKQVAPNVGGSSTPARERKGENPAASVQRRATVEAGPPSAHPLPALKAKSKVGHWGVSVGVGLNAPGHGVPLASGGEISIFRQEHAWGASVEASAFLPVDVSSRNDVITVNQRLLGASLHAFQPVGFAFKVFETLGAGLYGLSLEGLSTKQGTGHRVGYVVGYSTLGAGILSEFNERTALALRFRVVAPWRVGDVTVRDAFGDNTVAQLKFPVILGDLGLRVTF